MRIISYKGFDNIIIIKKAYGYSIFSYVYR